MGHRTVVGVTNEGYPQLVRLAKRVLVPELLPGASRRELMRARRALGEVTQASAVDVVAFARRALDGEMDTGGEVFLAAAPKDSGRGFVYAATISYDEPAPPERRLRSGRRSSRKSG